VKKAASAFLGNSRIYPIHNPDKPPNLFPDKPQPAGDRPRLPEISNLSLPGKPAVLTLPVLGTPKDQQKLPGFSLLPRLSDKPFVPNLPVLGAPFATSNNDDK